MSTAAVTRPAALALTPSFGFGDRLGCATPGHLQSLREQGGSIAGIFAQQSIREMARTQRTPTQVMDAAAGALSAGHFTKAWGADADHLKTEQDVDYTADAGFVFFTIDPSGHVDDQADGYDAATLAAKFAAVKGDVSWLGQYQGKTIAVDANTKITFDDVTVQRAAVKYGRAINHAIKLAGYIKAAAAKRGQDYEIEISVDETPQPTTIAEHFIIADQLIQAGVKLVSLAPRYVGDFEKGVDYKGDLSVFEKSFAQHMAIARRLGPYKLSLHSGSDKLSLYPSFARISGGLFHVKTAGTSYLEALRVAVIQDSALFRRIVDFSRDRYNTDKATYHVSATLADAPRSADVKDDTELERIYLERWADVPHQNGLPTRGFTAPGRQVLHCTFGSVLTDPTLGKALRDLLTAHLPTYTSVLAEHFGKHLAALRAGM
jgi:hypothetical protein